MYNDLADYSIMLNGDKAVTHTSSHYATSDFVGAAKKVILPPITGHLRLTENTLNTFNFQSMLSLTSATPSLTSASLAAELPLNSPKLLNAELAAPIFPDTAQKLISISSSPSTSFSVDSDESSGKKRRQRLGPSCDHCRARKVKCNADVVMLSRYFDPAELETEHKDDFTLTPCQKSQLCSGQEVRTDDKAVLVVSNNKLIRFMPCSSCSSKSLACCFSKGFTKEDVIHNKKKQCMRASVDDRKFSINKVTKRTQSPAPSEVNVGGLGHSSPVSCGVSVASSPEPASQSNFMYSPGVAGSTRKSSCTACRKRKIKCVPNSRSSKCMGCIKKDCLCSFEV